MRVKKARPQARRILAHGRSGNSPTPAAKAELSLVDTPLADAVRLVQDTHHIPVVMDVRALEDAGLDSSVPVTVNLASVSLRSAPEPDAGAAGVGGDRGPGRVEGDERRRQRP